MNERFRTFFITINKKAKCYDNIENILKSYVGGDDIYALIKHDKDIVTSEDVIQWEYEKDEQISQDDEAPIVNELKREHYHLMLEFKNARTFKTIQNMLPGAHIKRPISKTASYQYLIHKNHKEKYQYNKKEIKSNNISYVFIQIGNENIEPFDPNKILYYHLHPKYKLKNIIEYYNKFGKQVNHYRNLIKEMLEDFKKLDEEDKFNITNNTLFNENGEMI